MEAFGRKKIKTPAAANNWLRMVLMLMKFAVSKKMIASDPAADIKALQHHLSRGWKRTHGFSCDPLIRKIWI
jgi:hypothetical protein